MKLFDCKLMLAATFAGLSLTAQAALPVYTADFDAAPYTVNGSINGVQGWSVLNSEAKVVSGSGARGSAQFVELSAGAEVDLDLTTVGQLNGANTVWVEGYFRGAGSDTTLADARASYPSTAASAIVHFSSANGIEFLNGDRAGGDGTVTASNVALGAANANNWYKITIQLNFATSSWSVWVNNVSRGTNLGFKSSGVTKLNGFKNLAQNQAFFDAFRVVLPIAGDANGDQKKDSADVATLLLIASQVPGDASYDVITRTNGDVAAPSASLTIDNTDVQTLIDQITAGT
ncbi:hypothetical protein GC173_13290 [bacterium]|nr:hypothetical protein [bacterium]